MKRAFPILAALMLLLSHAGSSNAALIFYANRTAFDKANPGLPIEGFEKGNPATQSFTGPLYSFTDNASFSPGDILPGILFMDNPGPDPGEMFVAGPGQGANLTTAVGQNFPPTDALDILLKPGVAAVAFDLFQNFGGGDQSGVTKEYSVDVFGGGGLLGSTTVQVPSGAAGFLGVSSTTDLITRVSVNRDDAFEVIDNVAFGTPRTAQVIPEPGSLTLFSVAAVAAWGVLACRRRRKILSA